MDGWISVFFSSLSPVHTGDYSRRSAEFGDRPALSPDSLIGTNRKAVRHCRCEGNGGPAPK